VTFPDDVDDDGGSETVDRDSAVEEQTKVEAVEGKALKQTLQSVTKIDVGVQSQLLASPGSTVQLYFDVTNLRNEPTYHTFQVQDERRFLRQMEPRL
jgi:hypothetical protein